ncbi:MAG: hypothetical protein QOE90_3488 [Thermoplasmata archaeon]|jgi:hypothetical protein|nr:hypothetical protein [Thermoplasmata archaeon]
MRRLRGRGEKNKSRPRFAAKESQSDDIEFHLRATWLLLRDHWPVISAALVALISISGLEYFHTFYGAFGLDPLAYGQPWTTLAAIGALAGFAGLAGEFLVIFCSVAVLYVVRGLVEAVTKRQASSHAKKSATSGPRGSWPTVRRNLGWVAAAISIVVLAALPWQWLSPGLIRFILKVNPTEFFLIAFVFGVVFVSYVLALVWLDPRHKVRYVLVLMIVALPGVAGSIALERASSMETDPWSAPRALIWTNHTTNASEYVIIDQIGDRLFLLKKLDAFDPEKNATTTVFQVTTMLLSGIDRIEYLPAGTETKAYRFAPDAMHP